MKELVAHGSALNVFGGSHVCGLSSIFPTYMLPEKWLKFVSPRLVAKFCEKTQSFGKVRDYTI